MSPSFPQSRQSGGAARHRPAGHPAATADEQARLDCPSANEVMGEIAAILAVHLAAALVIVLALLACGIS